MSCAVPPDGTGRTHIKAGECRAVAILARSRRGRIAEQRGKKSVHGDGHHAAALSVAPALQPGMDDEGAYSRRSAARQICAYLWPAPIARGDNEHVSALIAIGGMEHAGGRRQKEG